MIRRSFLIALITLLVGCTIATTDSPSEVALAEMPTLASVAPLATPLPTAAATLTLIPTLAPTFTPESTATSAAPPSPTSTLPPTNTPPSSPTPIPPPTEPVVDRTCPDPPPRASDYRRYVLGDTPLPRPAADPLSDRIWFKKPLPGGGRYLINMGFPYGSDGEGVYLLHNGVDTAVALGNPVLAIGDGTVVVAQSDRNELWGWRCNWYGQLVVIELDETWQGQPIFALYGHVLNINVEVGDRVETGEQVAEVGFGGAAIAPHLHFELRVGENDFASTRNPMLWIEFPPSRGVVVGQLVNSEGRPWQGVEMRITQPEDESVTFTTWSYLEDSGVTINSDELFEENFVFADVWPGEYLLEVELGDAVYTAEFVVTGSEITTLTVVTP